MKRFLVIALAAASVAYRRAASAAPLILTT